MTKIPRAGDFRRGPFAPKSCCKYRNQPQKTTTFAHDIEPLPNSQQSPRLPTDAVCPIIRTQEALVTNHHEHDIFDRGLAADLETFYDRRRALKLLGAVGLVAGGAVAAMAAGHAETASAAVE